MINNYSTAGGEQVMLADLQVGDVLANGQTVRNVHVREFRGRKTVWVDTDRGESVITGRNRAVWIYRRHVVVGIL